MASTTSTEQSGLFAHLLPAFRKDSGIEVRVVALGTGQAIDMARRGDADLLLVHDKAAELKFVADGFGLARSDVMYNDFVLVGPKRRSGARGRAPTSRGRWPAWPTGRRHSSRAATAAAPTRPNCATGRRPASPIRPNASAGYKACGCGMGPALNIAASTGAYVLTDRAHLAQLPATAADLAVLVEGDRRLFNQYGVIVVDPKRHPHVRHAQAQAFADWLTGPRGQAAIAAYRIAGQQLFFPNAAR